jgi:hypothetical protein
VYNLGDIYSVAMNLFDSTGIGSDSDSGGEELDSIGSDDDDYGGYYFEVGEKIGVIFNLMFEK